RSNDVAKLAESLYGVTFPWKSLYSTVLRDIETAGFVTCRKTTSGRGAKPYLVTPTEKFAREIVLPILDGYPDKLGGQLRELRRTPLDQIVRALTAATTHVRGKALEMLALWLMFALDLDFVFWRKRGKETGGAEVDVVVESARLVFSRWQIQCKNGKATLEDVAKEYGLARHLRSNVIMVVTTRRFSSDAKRFADSIMKDTNLQVILLDEADLSLVVASPARLAEVLHAQAEHAMEVKDLHRAEE
ncbi:MAG: restriction endonuclease, partial [Myxococcota bacterium]|nr:restriction endonuclease [Myxococcota bacterium]